MTLATRFAISLDPKLFEQFEALRKKRNYATRSEAVRDLIRAELLADDWDDRLLAMGTITLVFNHHQHDLQEQLTHIQHTHHDLVISAMHLHLDHDYCLEVIAVRGAGRELQQLADRLISVKGVKHGKLTATSLGSDLA